MKTPVKPVRTAVATPVPDGESRAKSHPKESSHNSVNGVQWDSMRKWARQAEHREEARFEGRKQSGARNPPSDNPKASVIATH